MVFMAAAALLCAGLAVRSAMAFGDTRAPLEAVTGLCAALFGVALVVYAVRFVRRSKGVSWL